MDINAMQNLFISLIATLILVTDSHGSIKIFNECWQYVPNETLSRIMQLNPFVEVQRHCHIARTMFCLINNNS